MKGIKRRVARDLALILLMSAAALRRSEAAALLWDDFATGNDGSGFIMIWRSKTDQEGAGAVVAIKPDVCADLERWRGMSAKAGKMDSIFGLSTGQILRWIAARAQAAGLGAGFSGLSGRVGVATRLSRANVPTPLALQHCRWRSVEMYSHYTRNERAGEVQQYKY